MSNVCKHQCPIFSGVCNPVECEVIKDSNRELKSELNELLQSIDDYHYTFSVAELELFSRQKLDAGVKMMRLKNKISDRLISLF